MIACIITFLLTILPVEKIAELGKEYFGHPLEEFSAEPVSGGSINPVYLVDCEGQKLIFRFAPEWQAQSDFFKECYYSQMMAEKGVSPEIYYVSSRLRGTVMQYIPYSSGSRLNQKELQEKEEWVMDKVSEILEYVHIPKRVHPFPFLNGLLEEFKEGPHPKKVVEAIQLALEVEDEFSSEILCHNDLHLGNVLLSYENDDIYIIDWTYSQYGDPFMDLAKVARRLPHQEGILTHYLKREPTKEEEARFELAQLITLLDTALYEFELFLKEEGTMTEKLAKQIDADIEKAPSVNYKQYEGKEYSYWRSLSLIHTFLEFHPVGEVQK